MSSLKKSLPLLVLLGLAVGALVGCPPAIEGNSLYLRNWAVSTLTQVNLRIDDGSAWWGLNQLPAPLPGNGSQSQVINGIPDGRYDLRAVFATPPCGGFTGQAAIYRFGIPIIAQDFLWLFNLSGEAGGSGNCQITDSLTAQVN